MSCTKQRIAWAALKHQEETATPKMPRRVAGCVGLPLSFDGALTDTKTQARGISWREHGESVDRRDGEGEMTYLNQVNP